MLSTTAAARAVVAIAAIVASLMAGRISIPLLMMILIPHTRQPYIYSAVGPLLLTVATAALIVESYYIGGLHVWASAACTMLMAWLFVA
jgi:hypothetical protein